MKGFRFFLSNFVQQSRYISTITIQIEKIGIDIRHLVKRRVFTRIVKMIFSQLFQIFFHISNSFIRCVHQVCFRFIMNRFITLTTAFGKNFFRKNQVVKLIFL